MCAIAAEFATTHSAAVTVMELDAAAYYSLVFAVRNNRTTLKLCGGRIVLSDSLSVSDAGAILFKLPFVVHPVPFELGNFRFDAPASLRELFGID